MSILTWTKVGDMPTDDVYLKLLLYGDSGTGKTWAASTAPNPCYLLTEPNGLPTIRAANPDAVVVQADEMHGGMDTVRAFLKAAKDGTLARDTGCKTVVLDSMNELQRMIRDEIMRQKQGTPQEGTFTLQDWGTLTDKMRGLVRAFRDLPFHIVGITHASAESDEATNTRYVQPSFQGKSLPNEVAGYFSLVGFVYRERTTDDDGKTQVFHRVLLQGPPSVLTKGLPGLRPVEEPDLTAWLQRMEQASLPAGNGTAQTKPAPVTEAPDPTAPKKRSRRSRARAASTDQPAAS